MKRIYGADTTQIRRRYDAGMEKEELLYFYTYRMPDTSRLISGAVIDYSGAFIPSCI
jgi:hypothetical protein